MRRLILPVLWACWLAGQIARDRTWFTALMFYIPSPVLAVLLLLSATRALWAGHRRKVLCALAAALAPLWMVLGVENQWASHAQHDGPTQQFTLVHWNMCRGRLGWQRACRRLVREPADIYVVTEFASSGGVSRIMVDMPSSYTSVTASTMAIICRGTISQCEWLEHTRHVRIFTCVWRCDTNVVRLLCADMSSDIRQWRDPSLQLLRACIVSNRPDIVVGDFNAPRRSHALSALPEGYRHAYDAVGRGWSYSWPVPCPVYAIDQCIIGPRIVPLEYDFSSTTSSDHRMQGFRYGVQGIHSLRGCGAADNAGMVR